MTREAYGSLYQKGFAQTVRFLISKGIQSECATEAAQAGWATGWELREQLRNESFLKTWVNRIALNFHRQKLRREARICPLMEIAGESSAGKYVARIEMHRILDTCNPHDRALFRQWLTGASMSEIAVHLGITSTAARIRFLRARRSALSRLTIPQREPAVL